jgi:hypothetical protein
MTENAFRKLLNNASPPSSKVLPLVHDTTYTNFEKIITSGYLKPCICEVFSMNLLYFFYGRKAYKVSEKSIKLYSEGRLPASFIIKTDCVDSIYAVHPFDTGAYEKGKFKNYFSEKYKFEDFVLGSNIVDARQFMELFFTNNKNYIFLKTNRINTIHLIVNEYSNLINAKQDETFDNRCSTIEVQVFKEIPIPDVLEAIVIPEKYQGSNYVRQMVEKDIRILTYDTDSFLNPSEHNAVVKQRIIDYYREKKYI